jgi:DNA-binding response OmpR family regulator
MMGRGKVLVVDDDPIALELVRDRLTASGYTVLTRTEALGTSATIVQEAPDVVLLDVSMPGLSGERLAKLIAQNPKGHPVDIIFHSATDSKQLDSMVRQCNALGAIQKTADDAQFISRFEALLARRSSRGGR